MENQNLPGYSDTQVSMTARANFISKTYAHVVMAIILFTIIESYLFRSGLIVPLSQWLLSFNWLIVVGALMGISWLATHVSLRMASKPLQYLALAGFVAAQAVIFAPMLLIASSSKPGIIEDAAQITVIGCLGLSAVAFITRKDFSFMRGALVWAGVLALVAIVCGVLFGFQLGTWFSVAMIGFAGVAVLYDTSNIIHHFPEDRYVSAAMQLFASIALMFWYVLRLVMGSRN